MRKTFIKSSRLAKNRFLRSTCLHSAHTTSASIRKKKPCGKFQSSRHVKKPERGDYSPFVNVSSGILNTNSRQVTSGNSHSTLRWFSIPNQPSKSSSKKNVKSEPIRYSDPSTVLKKYLRNEQMF